MHASSRLIKTPLPAAFFCSTILLCACQSPVGSGQLPDSACALEPQPIASVQGSDFRSKLEGQVVTVRGIAIRVEPGQGVFIEELASDDDPATSNAIFIESATMAEHVRAGDRVVTAGTVAELGEGPDTLTSLVQIQGARVCESGIPLPASDSRLPLDATQREALEAMRVNFRQSMAVTDVYRMQQGVIGISPGRILPAPTEVARPGADARRQSTRNRDALLRVRLASEDRQPYSVAATVMAAAGVMGNDGRYPWLLAEEELAFMPVTQYLPPKPSSGDIRVVSLNLRNYFNGDGAGSGFPTPRGAETPAAFQAQRDRLIAAMSHLQPHLLGVMELENDGFGPRSAAQDLLADLETATGQAWAVIDPVNGPIGTDQITVGLFYRPDLLRPEGSGQILASGPFQHSSRPPVAQAFVPAAGGQSFLVVVNHLKSKGSCPDDGSNANKQDGQGCWNPARTEAARQMCAWSQDLANRLTKGRALIMGDMNAYRMEDPIQAIIESGFNDLTPSAGLAHEYTFVYRGEAGTLDYAFASPALRPKVRSAQVFNINSGYPPGIEPELPWLGSSDHDPVVVDLRLD